jgi:hypothetical protein
MENTMAIVSTEIITIPAYRENEFIEIITKLQKKQVKYNLPIGNYKEVKRYSKNIKHRTHIKGDCFRNDFINTVLMEFISFEVTGFSTIKKDDADNYIHVGTMSKDWNTDIMQVYTIEDTYYDWFKNYPDTCNHCGTQRKRNEYYVFAKENEDKPYYIGSTCVKDYFGFNAPDMLKLRTKIFHLINNNYDDDYNDDYKVISFNRIASYLDNRMTKSWDEIKEELRYEIDLFEDKSIISKDYSNLYDEVKNHYANPDSSFKQNASQVLKYDYCNRKNLMIYVCAVYYARKSIYLANKKANANQVMIKSNHNIGDKVTLNNVKVTFMKTFTTSYDGYHTSYTTLIKMVTDNNEVYETYSSGAFADNIKVNNIISITGTIKSKGTFNGNEYWKLTRCKLI